MCVCACVCGEGGGSAVSESDLERGNSTCCLHHGFTRKNSTLALLMSCSEDKERRGAGRDGRTARHRHPQMTASDHLVFQSCDAALKLTLGAFVAYVRPQQSLRHSREDGGGAFIQT